MSGRGKGSVSWHRWHLVWMLRSVGRGQRDIARELGVSLSTVQHYIRKGRPPRAAGWHFPDTQMTQKKAVSSGSPGNVVPFRRRRASGGGAA